MKLVSFGFAFSNRAYLRDPWNCLDLCVVALIIIDFATGSIYNWTILRSFRLLDFLRKQDYFPKLKGIVSSLFNSSLQIFTLYIILFVIILMFSLIGMAAFSGVTHYFCRTTPGPINNTWPISLNDTILWRLSSMLWEPNLWFFAIKLWCIR